MKKTILRLICCTAVLMLLCASSALADARVSITELAQSTPDYWESPLVVDGEQVMVPIYVPDVDRIPVWKAQWYRFSDEELSLLGKNVVSNTLYEFLIHEMDNYSIGKGVGCYIQVFLGNMWQPVWQPTFSPIFNERSTWNIETKHSKSTYATHQERSIADVVDKARKQVAELYGEDSPFSFFADRVNVLSPYMYQNDWEYTKEYPLDKLTGVGGYRLEGYLSYCGVPVFNTIDNAYQEGISDVLDDGVSRDFYYKFLYYADDYYWINGMPWIEDSVVYNDIPLCSVDEIISSVQREIDKGTIKNIQSLKLGYVVYASPDEEYPKGKKTTDEQWAQSKFLLVPTWVCECSYTKDPDRDYRKAVRDSKDAYDYSRQDWLRATLMINAQTGELFDPWNKSNDRDYAPAIKTW